MLRLTTGRHDVEAIKRDHPIADVVVSYGIELQSSGRGLVVGCPFHEEGGRPNLHGYPATQSWYCFRCAIGGDVIDFVARRENVGFAVACEQLGSGHLLPTRATPPPRRAE